MLGVHRAQDLQHAHVLLAMKRARLHLDARNGETLKPSEWDKYAVSWVVTIGMTVGAIFGAAALHLNPFGSRTDDWPLVPVALTLFFA